MARNALSAYRGVAISLATLIGFLFMLVSCVRLQRVVARQQEHIALLEARAAAAVAVPPASAPPKPPPPAPAAAVAHPPMVYPVLHYLNLKAENVFRAVLMARHPKASKDTLVIEIGSNDGKQALWAAQQVQAVAWVPAFNPKGVRSRGSGFEGPVQTRLWAVGIAVGGSFCRIQVDSGPHGGGGGFRLLLLSG